MPSALWLVLAWVTVTAVSLSIRPLLPIDETRYAAVAWEMWVRNDFLVPYLNGEAYSHKPPLLFWLMQLSWWLFGVNNWSLRLISPLFALANLFLTRRIAKELWPESTQIAELAPILLLASLPWLFFSTLTMFDIMLTYFVLLGVFSYIRLLGEGKTVNWCLLGLAIGGGILTKGPVILLHLLPLGLLLPWCLRSYTRALTWQSWYRGMLLAVVLGAVIALCWAIPAGLAGGESYQKAIFLGQTSGRVVDSFAHKLPFWWYLQLLPLLLLPWLLLPHLWAGFAKSKLKQSDFGLRFCLLWLVPVFLAFSLISGKRVHYMLPLMPAIALLLAWLLAQLGEWRWPRSHGWLMAVYGLWGAILLLMPWLNGQFHWQEEFSSVSWYWGILLLVVAVVIAFISAKNILTSVSYVTIATIVAVLSSAGAYFEVVGYRYDTTAAGQKISELLAEHKPLALYSNKYHGQYHFAGRITQPIPLILTQSDVATFAQQHPEGFVLVHYQTGEGLPENLVAFHYPFKNQWIGFLPAKALDQNPVLVKLIKPY